MIRLHWKRVVLPKAHRSHGLSRQELRAMRKDLAGAHAAVTAEWDAGRLAYADLPARRDYCRQVEALVDRLRGRTTDVVVLGIGGSALGSIALHAALNPVGYNLGAGRGRGSPRLFVLDNVDPALVSDRLALLGDRLRTTVFNVISKSGETVETAGQLLIVRELLRRRLGRRFGRQIVATTDPQRGALHDAAAADGCAILPVPREVGGRFSVLSPVGLFSAAMCGIDIRRLLRGAAGMARRVRQTDPLRNPACVLAGVKHLLTTGRGKRIHVMMPYSNRLYGLADWYRQLWAESLGKRTDRRGREVFAGPTPVKALGATDQHSQVQLYCDGPNDKLFVFLEVARHPADVAIPRPPDPMRDLACLGGKTLSQLLRAEKVATEYALWTCGRPSVTIRFSAIDAGSVGEFIFLYEFVTSLMGELLKVNAYDQPAVELGKNATFARLGRTDRPGAKKRYEALAGKIHDFQRVDEAYLL